MLYGVRACTGRVPLGQQPPEKASEKPSNTGEVADPSDSKLEHEHACSAQGEDGPQVWHKRGGRGGNRAHVQRRTLPSRVPYAVWDVECCFEVRHAYRLPSDGAWLVTLSVAAHVAMRLTSLVLLALRARPC